MGRTHLYGGKSYTVSKAHKAADAMPWDLDTEEFAALVQSMRDDGFDPDRPATRHGETGLLIDGRRRELAAVIAGVEPVYREVNWPEEEIVAWVSRDLARRNITPSQRAASAVELAGLLPKGRRGQIRNVADLTHQEIAEESGVGVRTIDDAAKVKAKAPELLETVKEGKLSASVAAKVADLPKRKREKVAKAKDPKKAAKEELAKKPDPETPADEGAEFVKEVETLCRDVDQIAARMKALKSSRFAYSINIDSSVSQVEAARKTFWQGRPAHPCPYCAGEGCKTCANTGRVKKATHESGKEAMGGGK